MTDIIDLCAKLDSLCENVPEDEASRKRLMSTAHNLSLALKKPGDTIQRIVYLVSICDYLPLELPNALAQPLQLTVSRVANDLELFDAIVDNPVSTTQDLASKREVDPVLLRKLKIPARKISYNTNMMLHCLLGRLLRYLASRRMVKEMPDDKCAATNITKALILPGLKAGINHK